MTKFKIEKITRTQKPFLLPLLLAIVTGGIGCAGKSVNSSTGTERHQTLPLIGPIQVQKYTLDNGLKILVVEDHTSPTIAYQTWYRVGSRDEVVGRTGLAHLFEHMMFKETKNMKEGEFERIMDTAGAENENAFTSQDYTAYVQELPKDKLDMIAKIEADRMVNLVVNDAAFKTEIQVVQNERRSRDENSPDGLMFQELYELAYTQHPYHWPVTGYQKDLDQMTVVDALQFYGSYYSPNHATIVVVGDVNSDDVLSTVQKYYGDLPPQTTLPLAVEPEPAQTAPRRKVLKLNIQSEKLMMGYHSPNMDNDDMASLDVLQTVLSGGKSSRLDRALVNSGIATGVGVYSQDSKDPSLFVVDVSLQRGKKAAHAESIILKEITRVSKELVSTEELARAKNIMNFHFYSGLETNSSKARFLGTYESITDNFETAIARYKRSQAVTSQDLLAVAKKYLVPTNRSVIVGVPK